MCACVYRGKEMGNSWKGSREPREGYRNHFNPVSGIAVWRVALILSCWSVFLYLCVCVAVLCICLCVVLVLLCLSVLETEK